MKQPYEWQKAALARFARAVYFALVVDCGCGKTLAATLIALAKKLPVIVIAPTHRLCDQWREDILRDGGPDEEVWVYDKPTETAQGESYREAFEVWLTQEQMPANQKYAS
jgi:superfamily II DNA or RNA helicase